MNTESTECFNTGFLKPEYVKNVTHCFCAAAEYECQKLKTENLKEGYNELCYNLINYSRAWSEKCGVKPIGRIEDDVLGYFFNQKNEIPGYVYYWFVQYYDGIFDKPSAYRGKHIQTYNGLQRLYIDHYRWVKIDRKSDIQFEKKMRRIVSKAFRSGEYAATFKLYNTDFIGSVSEKQFKNISDLIMMLFPKELAMCKDDEQAAALGYIIGRIQGASEAVQSTGNKLSDAIIDKVSKCTDKHKLSCIYSFVSGLL